jgi:hypothetical protein
MQLSPGNTESQTLDVQSKLDFLRGDSDHLGVICAVTRENATNAVASTQE